MCTYHMYSTLKFVLNTIYRLEVLKSNVLFEFIRWLSSLFDISTVRFLKTIFYSYSKVNADTYFCLLELGLCVPRWKLKAHSELDGILNFTEAAFPMILYENVSSEIYFGCSWLFP